MCECFMFKHFPSRSGWNSLSGAREILWHQKALRFNPWSTRFLVVPLQGEKNLGAGSSAVSKPGTVRGRRARRTGGPGTPMVTVHRWDKQGKAIFIHMTDTAGKSLQPSPGCFLLGYSTFVGLKLTDGHSSRFGNSRCQGDLQRISGYSESGINLNCPKVAGIALETALQGLRDEKSTYTYKLKLHV